MSPRRSEQLLLETRRIASHVPGPHGELLLAALDLWEQSGMEMQQDEGDSNHHLGPAGTQQPSETLACSPVGKEADGDTARPHAHSAIQDKDQELCSILSRLMPSITAPFESTEEPRMHEGGVAVSICEGSSWHCLPDDVAESIFAPLTAADAASCRLVCKSFYR